MTTERQVRRATYAEAIRSVRQHRNIMRRMCDDYERSLVRYPGNSIIESIRDHLRVQIKSFDMAARRIDFTARLQVGR